MSRAKTTKNQNSRAGWRTERKAALSITGARHTLVLCACQKKQDLKFSSFGRHSKFATRSSPRKPKVTGSRAGLEDVTHSHALHGGGSHSWASYPRSFAMCRRDAQHRERPSARAAPCQMRRKPGKPNNNTGGSSIATLAHAGRDKAKFQGDGGISAQL